MNSCNFTGNLTKDVVVGTTQKGKKYARFSFAVKKIGGDTDDFFRAVAWGKVAEFIEKGLADGRFLSGCEIEVQGEIHNVSGEWTDENGEKKTARYDELTVEKIISKKKNGSAPQQNGYQNVPQQQGAYQPMPQPQQGAYQAQAPQQSAYQAPPQPQQGAYQAPPQLQQGAYQAPPQPQQGAYQAPPQPRQGAYQAQAPQQDAYQAQAVQTGSFQQVPANNGQQGGFKAALVNAPKGQGSYGGYPEGAAGYGN